jgi:hypothetical protein
MRSSQKRFAIAEGPLMNNGEIFPADQKACHTISVNTITP